MHAGLVLLDRYEIVAPLAEGARASMHAKCLVVDDAEVLLTSANFTEAAQVRNIEAGVLVRNEFLAKSLREQFESLGRSGGLVKAVERTTKAQ